MELNREQIIKALECCAYGGDATKTQVEVCLPCPYFNEGNCTDILKENALSLIKELTEENERLRGCVKSKEEVEAIMRATYEPLVKEILKEQIDKAIADTLSELKNRLTREIGTYLGISIIRVEDMFNLIDKIAKEMIGGETIE